MNRILYKRTNEIRDLINSPRKQAALLEDSALWNMMCSSLDIIEDTEFGLDALPAEELNGSNEGIKYLIVYGALQALFLQQEGVENLCESLKIPYTVNAKLNEIRDIYNDSVGHPTKRGKGKGEAFNFISRATIEFQRFQLMTTYPDNTEADFKDIDIPELIEKQKDTICNVLMDIIKTLREEEMEHRKIFADKKLIDVFQDTAYPFEKIFDVVINSQSAHAERAESFVDRILESIEKFKNLLRERGEPDESYIYGYLDYSLQRLKVYFQNANEDGLNGNDAFIFADFAQRQVEELENRARELDGKYSQ